MSYYMVEDTELISVATAIRAVTGSTANLRWPDEYIAELNKTKIDPLYILSTLEIGSTLNETSWDVISLVAQLGMGDLVWDVGDAKLIVLNGNIGLNCTLSNKILYVFILDFNHPINKTIADNNIIFCGFKDTIDDANLRSLSDDLYNNNLTLNYLGRICFNMNHLYYSFAHHGGWAGCDFRYDILGATSSPPSQYNVVKTTGNIGYNAVPNTITAPVANTLMAALPNEFRKNLRLYDRYSNSVGGVDSHGVLVSTDSDYTKITDAISIMSAVEVFGGTPNTVVSSDNIDSYEFNHFKLFKYFQTGNNSNYYLHRYYNLQGYPRSTVLLSLFGSSGYGNIGYNTASMLYTHTLCGSSGGPTLSIMPIFKV